MNTELNFIWEKYWKNDCKKDLNFGFLFQTFHTVRIPIRNYTEEKITQTFQNT